MKELAEWCDKEEEEEDDYDAIVVGSGYGGSVAACRLSMAGIKVCLAEKGRRWESQDFPTDTLGILSSVRLENGNLGISLGPKDALFQLHEQGDSLAVAACGLGGGSLVNAGVMLPAPPRARRNPKWPKQWERDWEMCEAYASDMLRIQSVPLKFSNSKIMEQVLVSAGDDFENSSHGPMKLSVNFDIEDQQASKSMKSSQMSSCLACGNCLSGCPYNAKNSTDKTYLISALQAGCTIKTNCQVQYVVENPYYVCQKQERAGGKTKRRWLVFINDTDFLTADFVILSGGVFGTSDILFRSQLRGLRLSEKLGSGFSCNGNTVAYLAGSPAPLNAYGLHKKDFSNTPFQERPGPSISSSYASSLGFTIQSAVLPIAYPYLLFKGITTYGWPQGSWFLHGIIDKLKHLLQFKDSQAMILNAIGYDDANGKLTFDKEKNGISFHPPHDPLLPKKYEVFRKITKKLGGILFTSRYRSTSVHLLGGCNSSSDHSQGVCNHYGQVFDKKSHTSVHHGLYVCDASLIPCSVGVNPSLTIVTLAEHISKHLLKDILNYKIKEGTNPMEKFSHQNPGSTTIMNMKKIRKPMVVFKETMEGYLDGMPCKAYLIVKMGNRTRKELHEENKLSRQDKHFLLKGKVGGHIIFRALEMDKLHIIDGEVDMCEAKERTPYTQYMHYHLLLATSSGSRYILEGKKIMNPFVLALHAWKETTTMHTTLSKVGTDGLKEEMVKMKGKLRISGTELLKSLMSLDGDMKGRFICLLLHTFYTTYISQAPRRTHSSSEFHPRPYPNSTLHQLQTEDGFTISCRQWKCNQNPWELDAERNLNPVLLMNGYSIESFWLPTEPNDLVRTLLDEGHEVWLLQARSNPLNSSNNFTIEDIGKFDIPAAINKIHHIQGPRTKIHVVAHCIGGLAIHIALMGGHISAADVASLSCTNSSMFFKITAFSRLKMWLPLIPMSMAILGRNKILPLFTSSEASSRQRLLKSIARLMPRYERCTGDECEVFSGIFGNSFWHENVSPTMHHWLNKQNLPFIPMAAFPHLRKICRAGIIVGPNHENSYLSRPDRMAVPTLYISGGRTILVTPQTSFLAHNYMRLHQPSFRHERVVVEGFGHWDLLIGEESYKKVFPHILKHVRLAEERIKTCSMGGGERRKYNEEALSWAGDPFQEESGGYLSFMSPLFILWLFIFLLLSCLLYVKYS